MSTVDIDPNLLASLKQFRLGKNQASSAALVVKIDKAKLLMVSSSLYSLPLEWALSSSLLIEN